MKGAHARRERPPTFFAEACAGDDALRHEVESLLAHDFLRIQLR